MKRDDVSYQSLDADVQRFELSGLLRMKTMIDLLPLKGKETLRKSLGGKMMMMKSEAEKCELCRLSWRGAHTIIILSLEILG